MNKYIAYYRVSTKEQGDSGLGLSAQKKAVNNYINSVDGELISEYRDVESGSKRKRDGLQKAINDAYTNGAILVVKQLDRLSRGGLAIIVEMENLGIKFIESDSPSDSDLMKEIKLSLSRDELRKVSRRTKSSLSAINDNIERDGFHISKSGRKITSLGNTSNFLDGKGVIKSAEVRKRKALNNSDNKKAYAFISVLKDNGLTSYKISKQLNEAGFLTSRGNNFSPAAVDKLVKLFN